MKRTCRGNAFRIFVRLSICKSPSYKNKAPQYTSSGPQITFCVLVLTTQTKTARQAKMTSSSILPIDNSPDNAPSFTEVPMEKSSPSELLLPLLVAFAWAFDAQQNFISVFADADPTWRCLKSTDQICKASSNSCNLRPDSWAWVLPPPTLFIFPFEDSFFIYI